MAPDPCCFGRFRSDGARRMTVNSSGWQAAAIPPSLDIGRYPVADRVDDIRPVECRDGHVPRPK